MFKKWERIGGKICGKSCTSFRNLIELQMVRHVVRHPTQIAPDLATPRWYAARKAESGSGKRNVRSKNATPLKPTLGRSALSDRGRSERRAVKARFVVDQAHEGHAARRVPGAGGRRGRVCGSGGSRWFGRQCRAGKVGELCIGRFPRTTDGADAHPRTKRGGRTRPGVCAAHLNR